MPGFDFLQGLVRQAGTALPGMNAWITPTLDPEELDKRISELRTVQFWLEQNARLLGTTIQGLEVQRMTLNTLRSMNVSMGDLREAMAIRPTPEPTAEPAPAPPRAGPGPEPAAASAPAAGEGACPRPGGPDAMVGDADPAVRADRRPGPQGRAGHRAGHGPGLPGGRHAPAASRPPKAAPSATPKAPASARPAAGKTAAKTAAKTSTKAAGGAARAPARAAAKKAAPR
jgi:hypothetical protein